LWGACSSDKPVDPPPPDDVPLETDTANVCTNDQTEAGWHVLTTCRIEGQLLSVWGTGPEDVWTVGAGGQVLHFDGCEWSTLDSGTTADLWWVFGFKDGPTFMMGSEGTALQYTPDSGFVAMDTGVDVTLFGVWGPSPDRLWSIGFAPDNSEPSVILQYDGSAWSPVTGLPESITDTSHFFKVWGTSADDVWVVGRDDIILHWDGQSWSEDKSGLDEDWVTVTGRVKESGTPDIIIVGGRNQGTILQKTSSGWKSVGPEGYPPLQGVCVQPDGTAIATGVGATILQRTPGLLWNEALDAPFDVVDPVHPPVPGCKMPTPDYHACFADGEGAFFLVGGNFFGALTEGAILHKGPPISTQGL
jgi:hypothetical protein